MKIDLLDLSCYPHSGDSLAFEGTEDVSDEIDSGVLVPSDWVNRYAILAGTFDWLSPQYDNPQTPVTAMSWMEFAGLKEIEVFKAGHLAARGKK